MRSITSPASRRAGWSFSCTQSLRAHLILSEQPAEAPESVAERYKALTRLDESKRKSALKELDHFKGHERGRCRAGRHRRPGAAGHAAGERERAEPAPPGAVAAKADVPGRRPGPHGSARLPFNRVVARTRSRGGRCAGGCRGHVAGAECQRSHTPLSARSLPGRRRPWRHLRWRH